MRNAYFLFVLLRPPLTSQCRTSGAGGEGSAGERGPRHLRPDHPGGYVRGMDLPVRPPLEPMLGRLARQLPRDGYIYEPKWDGLRCLAFRAGSEVDLRSRNRRPLARYFPELVEALAALAEGRLLLDGEIG